MQFTLVQAHVAHPLLIPLSLTPSFIFSNCTTVGPQALVTIVGPQALVTIVGPQTLVTIVGPQALVTTVGPQALVISIPTAVISFTELHVLRFSYLSKS